MWHAPIRGPSVVGTGAATTLREGRRVLFSIPRVSWIGRGGLEPLDVVCQRENAGLYLLDA
jgi:hypothetical protein